MTAKFKEHLTRFFSFLEDKKLLLAISGGLDSMVMLHLFQKLNFKIAIAHCNFQLRGLESFGDQKFIQEYASANDIQLFVTQFDTLAFANDYKLSTQVAARELRYNWFYELIATQGFDTILTAHHADDNLETFLINLTRGTGIDGLTGIPSQNDSIIRPLLPFSRQEILTYANENNIQWREDSSNASDKYLRNKIRHNLVPLLKELNPDFLDSFQKTQAYLQESAAMVEDAAGMVFQQVVSQNDDVYEIELKKLLQLPNYKSYLYQWLKDFGFTAWEDIYELVYSLSGKQIFSSEYRLIKDRETLILSPLIEEFDKSEYFIKKGIQEVNIPIKLSFSMVESCTVVNNSIIFVDDDKLSYPLTIKRWSEGDVFYPFGMNGKSKKVSKFFKDEKLSIVDKEKVWILFSKEQIVWIIGMRQDERFKVDSITKNILKIQLQ